MAHADGVPYGSIFTQPLIPLGWKCPSCGRCYAPFMVMCSYCPGFGAEAHTTTMFPPNNNKTYVACPACGCTPCCAHTNTGCQPPAEVVKLS